jgi:hypothetical protein
MKADPRTHHNRFISRTPRTGSITLDSDIFFSFYAPAHGAEKLINSEDYITERTRTKIFLM